MRKKDSLTFGCCKACGEYKILTEEHIPPKSAYNNGTLKVYSADESLKTITDNNRDPWDFEGLKFKLKQGGNRFRTLCSSCNSYFGTHYVDYYQKVVKSFAFFLKTIDIEKETNICVTIEKFKPLVFIKEVVAMFASLTNIAKYKEIKTFLLNKNEVSLKNDKLRVYMSVFRGGIKRMSGWCVWVGTKGHFLVSEIVSYPFIFVLLGNANEHNDENCKHLGTNITNFASFKYEEEVDVKINLPINECNINFPCDYRTKEEIIQCRKNNE